MFAHVAHEAYALAQEASDGSRELAMLSQP